MGLRRASAAGASIGIGLAVVVLAAAAVAQEGVGWDTGRLGEAEARLRRAIERDPDDFDAYVRLGWHLARHGRMDEAIAHYESALEHHGDAGWFHLILGVLHQFLGRDEEAMAYYRDAIERDPDQGVAKNNLAYMMTERGVQLDRAHELARDARRLLPEEPHTADTLGWVLYKKGRPEAAIGYLREAERGMRSDDPLRCVVQHHLALAYEAAGQPESAQEVLRRALRDLERHFASRREEPAWAAALRSMHARLTGR